MAPTTPYHYRGKPPFSWTIFILALIEALLWVAPLLEAQNTNKTTFTFSLCDYLEREITSLKRVNQQFRVEEETCSENQAEYWDEETEAESQKLQIFLKEVAEARGRHHAVNASCLDPSMPYGRSKRQALTFRDEQQKKDGAGSGGVRTSKKGKEHHKTTTTTLAQLLHFLSYAISFSLVCVIGFTPRSKGMRPLSVMSGLSLIFLSNGAHALSFDDVVQTETPVADHRGFYLLHLVTPNKALFILLVVVTIIVYLLLCFWLSVGWLHFAKRLIFGATVPYRKEDGNDPEAAAHSPEDLDKDSDCDSEIETRTVSSMTPGMMVDFKFKTSVLSDALVAYSSILNFANLRDLLLGDDTAVPHLPPMVDDEGDDLE